MFNKLNYRIENINKLTLSYNCLIKKNEIYNIIEGQDPSFKLINNFKDIETIIKTENEYLIEYLYMNMNQIHNILYEEEQTIIIKEKMMNKFEDYYYLYLLIKNQPHLINYEYNYDVIKKLYKNFNDFNNGIMKIIQSKMILMLIYNYSSIIDNDNEYKTLKDNCLSTINLNKEELKQYLKNEDYSMIENEFELLKEYISVDDIYSQIII